MHRDGEQRSTETGLNSQGGYGGYGYFAVLPELLSQFHAFSIPPNPSPVRLPVPVAMLPTLAAVSVPGFPQSVLSAVLVSARFFFLAVLVPNYLHSFLLAEFPEGLAFPAIRIPKGFQSIELAILVSAFLPLLTAWAPLCSGPVSFAVLESALPL